VKQYLAAIFVAALFCGGATAKPAATPMLTDDAAFRAAFQASFRAFDGCGETVDGQLYRKALVEKVQNCPFTPDIKSAFRQWSDGAAAQGAADLRRYVAEHDKLPESLDRMKVQCRAEQKTPAYQKTVTALARYAKGAARFDEVTPEPCDIQAGAR
jgi:hypothetical protein